MAENIVRITEDEGVVKTVHKAGSGDLPQPKNIVHVHYELFIADKLLDSSLQRGEPLPVTLGEGSVIRGWELALNTMKLDEKATVIIKPEYGYGASGSPPQVPANATLRFEMEIVKIERPPTTAVELVPIANAIKEEGNKLYTEKKYAEAFAKYEKALDVFRHMFPKEDSERAKMNAVKSICLSNQAACKIQEQDWKVAKVCCESALDLDEKAVKAIYRRGQCFVGLGEFERGLEDYKRALELDPKNAIVPKLIEEAKKKQQNYNKKSKAMYSKMFATEDKEK